jgi:hypothetical protein
MTLVIQNVGKSIPGVSESKPIWNLGRYGICIAENEEESPWEPLHVEKGYDPDTSTVTVYDEMDLRRGHVGGIGRLSGIFDVDVLREARQIALTAYPRGIRRDASFYFITPLVARLYANQGWSKQDLKEFFYEHCRSDLQEWYRDYPEEVREYILNTELSRAPVWMQQAGTSIPVFRSPEHIWVVVVGPQTDDRYWAFSSHHGGHPTVMKPISFADGTPAKSVYDFKRQ